MAVPVEHAVEAVRDCAQAGVKGCVLITAQFAEMGEEGARRQAAVVAAAREHGMRLLGPNCLGYVNPIGRTAMSSTLVAVGDRHDAGRQHRTRQPVGRAHGLDDRRRRGHGRRVLGLRVGRQPVRPRARRLRRVPGRRSGDRSHLPVRRRPGGAGAFPRGSRSRARQRQAGPDGEVRPHRIGRARREVAHRQPRRARTPGCRRRAARTACC